MFAKERQEEIVNIINANGSVRVKDLSKKFNVTEDSIRKDLTLLEKKGLIQKTYGGAVRKKRINEYDFNIVQRLDKNIESKQKIANKALDLINNGDTIFLDISTTNIELAKSLISSDKNITVVTNMVDIMLQLRNSKNINLNFIGGIFNRNNDGFIGAVAIEQIKNYKFDISFMGIVGVDIYENNVTTYMIDDGITKREILKVSKKCYMMLETRKFFNDGTYKYASIEQFSGAIMDKRPEYDIEKKLKEYNLDLIY